MQVNNAMTRPTNNILPGVNAPRTGRNDNQKMPIEEAPALPVAQKPSANQSAPETRQITVSDKHIGGSGEGPAARELTIEGLRNAWGTDNARYDLNSDGTVDVLDLMSLIKSMGENGKVVPNSGTEPTVGNPDETVGMPAPLGGPTTENDLTLEGLREAWGTADSKYDLNGDGTVDVTDLLTLLSQLERTKPDAQAPPKVDENNTHTPTGQSGPTEVGANNQMQSLTATMLQKLQEDGFSQHPPSNIHQFINSLEISSTQKQDLLQELATHYPRGLGVDLTI